MTTYCCLFFSVHTGCILGGIAILISAVAKSVMLKLNPLLEAAETIMVLNIVLLCLSGGLLLVGTLKEDRVCVITFMCFILSGTALQSIGLLVLYAIYPEIKTAFWILLSVAWENALFVYLVNVAAAELRSIREKHMRYHERYSSIGPTSSEVIMHPPIHEGFAY